MIVRTGVKPLVFREEENTVTVQYSNRGEPYREGVQLTFADESWNKPHVTVLLTESEVVQLRDTLNAYLGQAAAQPLVAEPVTQSEMFGRYDGLNRIDPVFGELFTVDAVANIAAKANYGAVRLATALVRAIEERDSDAGRLQSSLGVGLRRLIESGAF